jgi:hypothetical protein
VKAGCGTALAMTIRSGVMKTNIDNPQGQDKFHAALFRVKEACRNCLQFYAQYAATERRINSIFSVLFKLILDPDR